MRLWLVVAVVVVIVWYLSRDGGHRFFTISEPVVIEVD
jgi:hypothetical protein